MIPPSWSSWLSSGPADGQTGQTFQEPHELGLGQYSDAKPSYKPSHRMDSETKNQQEHSE